MKALTIIVLVIATIWCTGNIVLVAIGAPGIFKHAPPLATHLEKDLAGAIFGDLLQRWTNVVESGLLPVLATLTAVTAGAYIGIRRYLQASFLFVMILAIGGTHLWSRNILHETITTAPPLNAEQPYSAEQRQVFNALHARSTHAFGTETALLLLFLISVGIVLSRRDEQAPASAAPSIR